MTKKELGFVISSFLIWRLGLFLILFFAIKFLPLQQHFIGGGIINYTKTPWYWAWANFDGENYLSIAQYGYMFAAQAFFPLYPLIIKIIGSLFGGGIANFNTAGFIISNLSFVLALIGFYKLIKLDYSDKIARITVLLLLIFPTSFYFGSVYTESIFLALVVWSFYFARRRRWFLASILGMFASATRVIGILLLPVLAIKKRSFWLLLIPFGLMAYMIFLRQTTGDSLAFLHTLSGFGEQRSSVPILLPQVFYRYIFKILPNLNYLYFPVVFATYLEFLVGLLFLLLIIYSFGKLRIDYWIFLALGYLVPTLSGSFSSLPRYVIVLFPAFILLALWTEKLSRPLKIVLYGILFSSLAVASAMFLRGYWLA